MTLRDRVWSVQHLHTRSARPASLQMWRRLLLTADVSDFTYLQTWSRILAKTHFNYPLPTIVTPGCGRLSTGVKCCYCTPDDARLFLAALSSIDPANHHNTPRWYATKGSQFHTNHPSRIMDFVAHGVWISGQMEDDNPASLLLIRGLENWERHQTSQRHFWARK